MGKILCTIATPSDFTDLGVSVDSLEGSQGSGSSSSVSGSAGGPGVSIWDDELFEYDDFMTATGSDAVSLEVIHEDIQLLNVNIMFMYSILTVLFMVKKWR